MKFTVIGHACLYVEYKNIRLLIDPWIIGSCYWRSWWNYPEVTKDLISYVNPTHIYITHLHWDHYHGPSLRKFQNCNPKILLPKHFSKRMKGDLLKDFNFSNILELDHGKKYKLRDNFQLASYQFNPVIIDSALVVEVDGITLLDTNDSKTFGLSLKQIINNHPKIDFAFRSHSSAAPIPHCIRGMNVDETDRKPSDYADDFIAFAKATKSKYTIPFASSHIYLHELSKKFNKYYSDPSFVKKQFDLKVDSYQQCQIMVSGSSWSKNNGFSIKEHDFSNLKSDISNYAIRNKEKLERQYALELKQKLNKKAFVNYFNNFLQACSFPLKLLKFRFGFLINEKRNSNIFLCIIDGMKNSTEIIKISQEAEIYKKKLAFVIKTPLYVFNDCNIKRMHNTYTPSKLLEIIITEKNGYKKLNRYLSLVDFYENDSLPFNKLFSIRNIIIIFRRWRELIDVAYYFFIIKIEKKKIHQLWHSL
tara:strand:+ start:317 stop:1744 length:1428 start_codon:yes stop_codon:yes gene_type:complete